MRKVILCSIFAWLSLCCVVNAQMLPSGGGAMIPVGPTSLGTAVQSFAGLQFAIAQTGIGSPAGSMAGYVLGDNITLQCPGVTFGTAPIIGVTGVSGGAVTTMTVAASGITSNAIPSGSITCTQLSTSGVGTGFQVAVTFGLIAASIQPASLATGGGAGNGNFFLNQNSTDASPVIAGPENTFVGTKAGLGFTGNSGFNTALGHNACGNGGTLAVGNNNICIGTDAGRNFSGTFSAIIAIGSGAGRNASNTGSIYIGNQAGGSGGTNSAGTVNGNTNVVMGFTAGNALVGGSGHLLLGQRAGSAIVAGINDIMLNSGGGSDGCANGDESNVFSVCNGNAGRTISNTGGNVPSTSVTTLAGVLKVSGITTDATHTDATVCEDTTTHQFYFGSGTAGICLGTSSARFKHDLRALDTGLEQIVALEPVAYHVNADHGDPNKLLYGFTAEQAGKVLPALVGEDAEGKPNTFDYLGVVPVLVKAMQEQQKEIAALKVANDNHWCFWRVCLR